MTSVQSGHVRQDTSAGYASGSQTKGTPSDRNSHLPLALDSSIGKLPPSPSTESLSTGEVVLTFLQQGVLSLFLNEFSITATMVTSKNVRVALLQNPEAIAFLFEEEWLRMQRRGETSVAQLESTIAKYANLNEEYRAWVSRLEVSDVHDDRRIVSDAYDSDAESDSPDVLNPGAEQRVIDFICACIQQFVRLRKVVIDMMNPAPIWFQTLTARSATLRTLALCQIYPLDINVASAIGRLPAGITELVICGGSGFGDDELISIFSGELGKSVQILRLNCVDVTSAGLKVVLPKLEHLTEIDWEYFCSGHGTDFLRALLPSNVVSYKLHDTVRSLKLHDNMFSPVHTQSVCVSLPFWKKLEEFHLGRTNHVDDAVLQVVSTVLYFKRLRKLDFECHPSGEAGNDRRRAAVTDAGVSCLVDACHEHAKLQEEYGLHRLIPKEDIPPTPKGKKRNFGCLLSLNLCGHHGITDVSAELIAEALGKPDLVTLVELQIYDTGISVHGSRLLVDSMLHTVNTELRDLRVPSDEPCPSGSYTPVPHGVQKYEKRHIKKTLIPFAHGSNVVMQYFLQCVRITAN